MKDLPAIKTPAIKKTILNEPMTAAVQETPLSHRPRTAHQNEFRDALLELDARRARGLWHQAFPKMPAPENDEETLLQMHVVRTRLQTIPPRHRYYSHAWLRDHGLEIASQLPDRLKPSADRMYPIIASTTGVMSRSAIPEVSYAIDGAMRNAVMTLLHDGITNTEIMRKEILNARDKERKSLGLLLRERAGVK